MERSHLITIRIPGKPLPFMINCSEKESILDGMLRNGVKTRADCGGRGTCGKCRIRVLQGEIDVSAQDLKIFSEKELEQGNRLSCRAYPKTDCSILLLTEEEKDFDAVTDHFTKREKLSDNQAVNPEGNYDLAIDLGTTTLAFSLIKDKNIIRTFTSVNLQRGYGADVISRIKASVEGKKEILKEVIRKELHRGICTMILEEGIRPEQLRQIVISGNTTMGHLFMGYSCETLGVFPFTPYRIDTIRTSYQDVFDEPYRIPVIILPGISAFVGGDIVAGLYSCGFHESDKPCLLIDLGTNGEMAVGNKNRIMVTSTAAGPAFEGGNISCGVGSVPGAISKVSILNDQISYQTIGNKEPIGICGTGVIEMASELLKAGWMDETGLLAEPYFDKGVKIADLYLTQRDIRELQLAKGAVRAGIETLIHRYGIRYEQLDKVYLAGGFGYKTDILKAIHVGLLPEELVGKMEAVGNSSLAGAVRYLTERDSEKILEEIRSGSTEIHLSNDREFNDLYIKYMSF